MSKTYKRFTEYCYRSPRGKRQALLAGARGKAIPPCAYDDISFDNQCYLPYKVAEALASKKGMAYQDIVQRMMKKFKMRLGQAEEVAWRAVWHRYLDRREGLLSIYEEEELK